MSRPDGHGRPRKRFGQHFLEPAWAAKLVAAINPQPSDVFLEIGPGRGALTRLLHPARHVVAVEIDRDLVAVLQEADLPGLTVIEGDILAMPPDRVIAEVARVAGPDARVRVVGNLPYNVASPILFRLAGWYASGLRIADATVMLPREVADRVTSPVGTGDYSVLTIRVRQWADAVRLFALPPGAFRPAPRVESAVVRLTFHPAVPAPRDQHIFEAITQAIFTRRRKTLTNALEAYDAVPGRPAVMLARAGIDGRRRPETLALAELAALADAYAGDSPP